MEKQLAIRFTLMPNNFADAVNFEIQRSTAINYGSDYTEGNACGAVMPAAAVPSRSCRFDPWVG